MFSHGCGGRPGLSIQNEPLLDSGTNQRPQRSGSFFIQSRRRRMTQKIFRILILLAVSGLAVSGAQLQAQPTPAAPNSSPNTTPNGSPNSNPPSNTTPNANQQPNPKRPAAAPAGAVPPALQAGITAMLSAKTTLETAGDKWGGHRIKAIALIDKALDACGQTQTPSKGETKSGAKDDPA